MTLFVAEIGINHNGQFGEAVRLVHAAARAGCGGVKFQLLDPDTFLTPEQYAAAHPKPENAFGPSYGAHKKALELTRYEHATLKVIAHRLGLVYGVSVFDAVSADAALDLAPDYIKIPSALCMCWPIHDRLLKHWPASKYHVSLGMTTSAERSEVRRGLPHGVTYYTSTSDYSGDAAPYWDHGTGFSCHTPDPIYGLAAVILGAPVVEYHITSARYQKGTDHRISLLPEEFAWMIGAHRKAAEIRPKPLDMPPGEADAKAKLWRASQST